MRLDCKLSASVQNSVRLSVCQECAGADGNVEVPVLIVLYVHC